MALHASNGITEYEKQQPCVIKTLFSALHSLVHVTAVGVSHWQKMEKLVTTADIASSDAVTSSLL